MRNVMNSALICNVHTFWFCSRYESLLRRYRRRTTESPSEITSDNSSYRSQSFRRQFLVSCDRPPTQAPYRSRAIAPWGIQIALSCSFVSSTVGIPLYALHTKPAGTRFVYRYGQQSCYSWYFVHAPMYRYKMREPSGERLQQLLRPLR